MAWIESHQTLRSHPKTRKAARALGIPPAHLMGHLHCLWHWALDLAEDGDLSKFDGEDIAIAADWDGDADEFVDALLDCGFGDGPGFLERDGSCGDPAEGRTGSLVLHDWWTYAGKLVARRQRDRRRKAADRSEGPSHDAPQDTTTDTVAPSDGGPQDVPGTSEGGSRPPAHARPDPTEPDPTEPETPGDGKRRKPDPIFDALVAECGLDPKQLTPSARGRVNKAAKELRDIGATAEGIKARARIHRSKWPKAELTPTSLSTNYAQLAAASRPPPSEQRRADQVVGTPEYEARVQSEQQQREALIGGHR